MCKLLVAVVDMFSRCRMQRATCVLTRVNRCVFGGQSAPLRLKTYRLMLVKVVCRVVGLWTGLGRGAGLGTWLFRCVVGWAVTVFIVFYLR